MIDKNGIIDAYVFLRKHNMSIPDEVLDFIKHAALEKLEGKLEQQLADSKDECERLRKELAKPNDALSFEF